MTAGAPQEPTGTDAVASYVYAVTRDLDEGALATSTGIGGGAVRVVAITAGSGLAAASLQAVVGDVDPVDFSTHALAEHREDLAWLGAMARAHHEVVAAVGARRPVVPLSLATVYHDDDRVRSAIGERAAVFEAALDRVAGRAEWGVKAFVRPRAAGASRQRPASGRDYLRARRTALREGESATDEATRAGEELHLALSSRAVEVRRHRLQDAALTGRSETMVLNGAYLLDAAADGPEADAASLREVIGSWADDARITVELTGPWVPYSFAAAPDEQQQEVP